MTDHPEDLLAPYVDGDLHPADRRAVAAHLRSCERCRGEVEVAKRAKAALASLPEVPAPAGTSFRVLREARRAPAAGRAWRIATAVGVAASLLLGGVVLLERADLGGGDGGEEAATGAMGRGAPAQAEAGAPDGSAAMRANRFEPVLVASNQRYTPDDMPDVLDRLARQANAVLAGRRQAATTEGFEDSAALDRGRAAAAVECSSSAIQAATAIDDPGIPFVFEKASFYDEFAGEYVPGYVAAYLHAPAPNEEPTLLFMTVIDRETCERLLYYAQPVRL